MGQLTKKQIQDDSIKRRERILGYITQDPPPPLTAIIQMEGMTQRACRDIIHELEKEHNITYMTRRVRAHREDMPFGLTPATSRLRQRLGDHLYMLRERGNDSKVQGRYSVAPLVGMNNRQQIRAEQRPFNHDWTLSQIERLAQQLNRDPREFLLSCLTA